jgi:biopolymer transport protein ExbD
MAEIIDGGGHDKGGKKRPKKGHVHMDMTPMVDLAFLLLTFFILATSLSKPKTMEIVYPKEVKDQKTTTKIDDDLATTLIVGERDDQIFYYHGKFRVDTTELIPTNFSKDGLRVILMERNRHVNDRVDALAKRYKGGELNKQQFDSLVTEATGDSLGTFVIIKTLPVTKWKNVVNAVDELNITNIRKRAIQDVDAREAKLFLTEEELVKYKLK